MAPFGVEEGAVLVSVLLAPAVLLPGGIVTVFELEPDRVDEEPELVLEPEPEVVLDPEPAVMLNMSDCA